MLNPYFAIYVICENAEAFYLSGVVLIAGAAITLLMKFVKQPDVTEGPEEVKAQEMGILIIEKVTVL